MSLHALIEGALPTIRSSPAWGLAEGYDLVLVHGISLESQMSDRENADRFEDLFQQVLES